MVAEGTQFTGSWNSVPRPDFSTDTSIGDIAEAYRDGRDAFDRGNYELALDLASRCEDEELAAMAMIMLGAAKFGKSKLESYAAANPASWFYLAYADWCQGRTREALKCLAMAEANGGDPNADRLRELIELVPHCWTVWRRS